MRRPIIQQNRGRITAGGGSVDPSSIFGANLRLWYRADAANIVLNGGDVAGWVNRGLATGVDTAQGTPAQQPLYVASGINGRPCVRFTRANTDLLSVASGGPSQLADHSIFIFCTLNAVSGGSYAGFFGVGDNTKSSGIGYETTSSAWYGGSNLAGPVGAAVSAGNTYRLGKVISGANTQGYRSGVADGAPAVNVYNAATNVTIGAYEGGGTGCGDVDVYDILGVNAAASAVQIADVFSYFNMRYGP